MTLPKINRRRALARWLQDRRRHRRTPSLKPQYPGLLVWDWPYANPYQWRVYWSNTPDGPWLFIDDYWHYGDARQFAPDGGSSYHLVVGVDLAGNEVTGRSNAVRPDDAMAPLEYGLAGYWKLDESSGTRADSAGPNPLLDVHASVAGASGLIGNGAFFDALAAIPTELAAEISLPDTQVFSFSMWAKMYEVHDQYYPCPLVLEFDSGASYLALSMNPDVLGIWTYTPESGDWGNYWGVVFDEWFHVVLSFDESHTGKLYVNGELSGSYAYEFWGLPVTKIRLSGAQPWSGIIDECAFWCGRSLSDGEVAALYHDGLGQPLYP